jgi:hypothetical protein
MRLTSNAFRICLLTALVIILFTTMLSACQIHQGFLLLPISPKIVAINEIMTHEREGWHIEANSVQTFITQEVGDWVLVGVRLNAQIQNNVGGPIQRAGCVFVEKTMKKSIAWTASSAGSLCTVEKVLTISSGWVRGDNFQQEPEYNVVYGFFEPTMTQDVVVTWQDGQSIHLTPDQNTFLAVHPGPGKADYTKVEFFDANGELIDVYQPSKE